MSLQFDVLNSPLTDQIKKYTIENRKEIFVGIPAEITNVDDYESLQCVTVKPLINDTVLRDDSSVIQQSEIKKVFVKLPSAGGFSIKFPVKVGDLCTLNYSHRNISPYLEGSGGSVNVSIESLAELNDCWVELGFGTRSNNLSPSKTDLIIEGENNSITMKPSGDIEIKSSTEVTIDVPESIITGNCTQTGNMTQTGNQITTGEISATIKIAAPILQGTLQGPGGGPAESDTTFTATELHANNGFSGTFTEHTGKTVTVVDGIIISVV